MWSLRQKPDGSFFLVFDKERRPNHSLRGLWEFVGKQDSIYTARCVRINTEAGLLCANDNEGNVRVLVLEE
jgi:hypothetical protein